MYSPPPRPHLSADHHWGRISFWRSLLLELSTASLDPRVRSAFFLPLPLSHHDDLYGTCKVPSWPHCSSNCAFADCTNVWSEAAQRKLFRLAAPWAILKANIQVIFSQMTHSSLLLVANVQTSCEQVDIRSDVTLTIGISCFLEESSSHLQLEVIYQRFIAPLFSSG